MKKVVLLFPDTIAIVDFLLQHKIPGLEVNTLELSISGMLTEQQIVHICTAYKAVLKKMDVTVPFEATAHYNEPE